MQCGIVVDIQVKRILLYTTVRVIEYEYGKELTCTI